MTIKDELKATTLFRESTGLPMSSSFELLPETIQCSIEESAETIDGLQDMLVTNIGAALQTTDNEKSAVLLDYCGRIQAAMELLGFNNEFSRNEVLDANLSKLCTDADEVERTIEKYRGLGVECYVVDTDNQMFGVYCAETVEGKDGKEYPKGKLLKGVGFRTPVFNAENIRQWFNNENMLRVFGL